MTRMQETGTVCGVVVPLKKRTPLVDRLLRVLLDLQEENEKLRAEINRLKGLRLQASTNCATEFFTIGPPSDRAF